MMFQFNLIQECDLKSVLNFSISMHESLLKSKAIQNKPPSFHPSLLIHWGQNVCCGKKFGAAHLFQGLFHELDHEITNG